MRKINLIRLFVFCLLLANLVSAETSDTGVEYDNKINALFLVMDEVPVIVKVKDTTNIIISKSDTIEVQEVKDRERKSILNMTSNSVLATLSEENFQLDGKLVSGRGFYGNITKEGFNKLLKDTRVKKIHDNTIKGRELVGGSNKTPIQFIFVSLLIILFILLVLLLIILVRKGKSKK